MKKQCFVGLGGAGKNSIRPFIENEKEAEFAVIDIEFYKGKDCDTIDANDHEKVLSYFEKDREYVFLLGLSCRLFSEKDTTGVGLMKLIGHSFNQQKRNFSMLLGLPFRFEYGEKRQAKLEKLRQELEKLTSNIMIVDNQKYLELYPNESLDIMDVFHYETWKNYRKD